MLEAAIYLLRRLHKHSAAVSSGAASVEEALRWAAVAAPRIGPSALVHLLPRILVKQLLFPCHTGRKR